jgi:hypothetical protein
MPPTLLVGIDRVAVWELRRIAGVADGARRASRSTAARVFAFPRLIWMSLANPMAARAARTRLAHLISM